MKRAPRHGETIATVERIAAESGCLPLLPQIAVARRLLREDAAIQIGFWGRFKAGKSRCLNMLAGTDLLPVGVLPVTAVPTVLRHGPAAAARVEFLDGTTAPAPLERLADFITEAGNPGNTRGVRRVVLALSSVQGGVEWVDTPGTGSAHAHNTAAAEEEIPLATAAVLAISVDHPISEDDAALLRSLCGSTPVVAIALTKADRLTDTELRQVADFTRGQAARVADREIPVFPLSSLPPEADPRIGGWRERFEGAWIESLTGGRGEAVSAVAEHKVKSLVAACRDWISVRLAAAEKGAADRQLVTRLLEELHAAAPLFQKQLKLLVRDFEMTLPDRLMNTLQAQQAATQADMVVDLRRIWPSWQMNLWRMTRTYERWMLEHIAARLPALAERERDSLSLPLHELARDMERTLRQYWTTTADRIERVLSIRLPPPDIAVSMPEQRMPHLSVGQVFATHWDLLWFVVPIRLFRGALLRHFVRLTRWEVEKHVSRLAFAWRDQLIAAARAAAHRESLLLEEQHGAVLGLLSAQRNDASLFRQRLAELDQAAAADM